MINTIELFVYAFGRISLHSKVLEVGSWSVSKQKQCFPNPLLLNGEAIKYNYNQLKKTYDPCF